MRSQPDLPQLRRIEKPLIPQIVDSQQRPCTRQFRILAQRVAQIYRQQAGLPVMAMKYVRVKHLAGNLQRGARQHCKPDMVVRVIAVSVSIQCAVAAFRAIKLATFHEIMRYGPRLNLSASGPDRNLKLPIAQRDRHLFDHPIRLCLGRLHITGHDHRHLIAQSRQRLRQGAHNVRKTAASRPGTHLGRHHHDPFAQHTRML